MDANELINDLREAILEERLLHPENIYGKNTDRAYLCGYFKTLLVLGAARDENFAKYIRDHLSSLRTAIDEHRRQAVA